MEYLNEEEKRDITPVIEFLNNIKFLASAYEQIWVIKKKVFNGENTIAFVDDRSGETKLIIVNPDKAMQLAIDEIVTRGWFTVKEEYLLTAEKHFEDARVILVENEEFIENSEQS